MVDTSAFYSALDRRDPNHAEAARCFVEVLRGDETLLTHNYVVLETFSLLQRRLGIPAARHFLDELLPGVPVHWIDQGLHDRAIAACLATGSRGLSLVDCISFDLMRLRGVDRAFAFDADFKAQGFRLLPD